MLLVGLFSDFYQSLSGFSKFSKDLSYLPSSMNFFIAKEIIYMSHFSYACKMRYPLNLVLEKFQISLVLLNFLHCNLRLWFETPKAFESYPCHASEMIRNTFNHCLKFPLHSIFCHICYGKISEKNFNTFIKVKLLVSKTSDSCFQGFDFFQMLLASHR